MSKTFSLFKPYILVSDLSEIIYTVPDGKSVILDINIFSPDALEDTPLKVSICVIKPNSPPLEFTAGRVVSGIVSKNTPLRADKCILESNDKLRIDIISMTDAESLYVQLWGIIQ